MLNTDRMQQAAKHLTGVDYERTNEQQAKMHLEYNLELAPEFDEARGALQELNR